MFELSANKILLAASALLLCAGFVQAQTPPASPLTASPTSVGISYQIGGGAGAAVPVTLTIASGAGDAFVIDPTTVPFWLSLSATSGTAVPSNPGPAVSVSFNAGAAAGTLTAGIYTASVHVRVNGFQDLVEPVTLTVSGVASTLSVMNGATPIANNGNVNIAWVYGSTPLPTTTLTILSSNSPIAFTAASAVTLPSTENWIQLSSASGIAYNYGTPLTVSFSQDALTNATVGGSLTGTVTVTYGGGSILIHFTITVGEPTSAITSIFPRETPLHGSGTLTVVVTGTGFGTVGQGYASPTVVKIAYGVTAATNLTTITDGVVTGAINVVNPTTIVLTIPWEDGSNASILNTAQPVTISISNGLGGEVAATATLNVTASPIIYSVTNAAALEEPAAGSSPNLAPYELITIFGDNFGPTAGTPVLGTLDGSSRYPASLTANAHTLTVAVNKQTGTLIANAYLLFATNNQINALVPSGIIASGTTGLQIVVTYDNLPSNANYTYTANPVAASPGIFTTSASGQGQGAILLSNFTVNSSAASADKAVKGTTVLIYVAGLGVPNSSSADSNSTSAAKFPGSCISPASYVTAEGLANPATTDGAVILATKVATGKLPPCFTTSPAVSIGGQTASVTYAGWVANSVSGLYQINATVPTKAASGNAIPVVVTVGGVSSQAGVTMAIQ